MYVIFTIYVIGTTIINIGDTVVWTWTDTLQHTVQSTGLFNSGSNTYIHNTQYNGYLYKPFIVIIS